MIDFNEVDGNIHALQLRALDIRKIALIGLSRRLPLRYISLSFSNIKCQTNTSLSTGTSLITSFVTNFCKDREEQNDQQTY